MRIRRKGVGVFVLELDGSMGGADGKYRTLLTTGECGTPAEFLANGTCGEALKSEVFRFGRDVEIF
jgi:hypothetical protein